MSTIAAPRPSGRLNPLSGRLALSAMFLAFCYTLLSWRAVLLSDAAPIISERRMLALLVGTAVFWLILKRLDSSERVTLARAASWIVAGTALVLMARVLLGWLMPALPLTLSYEVRWSLAWGAYFGLWVMGAITFRRRKARQVVVSQTQRRAETVGLGPVALVELEWLLDALAPELAQLTPATRDQIADRLLTTAGGYEVADEGDPWSAGHNARVQLASRLAERIRVC